MCNFPRDKRLGFWRAAGCNGGQALRQLQTGGRVLRLGQTLEVAAWEIAHLESCHFGKYPGKLLLGNMPLRKYLQPLNLLATEFWTLTQQLVNKSLDNLEFEVSQRLRLWFFPTNPLLLFCSPWYIHVNI